MDHVVRLQKDPEFREAYRGASLVVADGMPVVWASRLLGKGLKQRVTGSDLVPEVCRLASETGRTVFFLGGNPGVAEKAGENLAKLYPGLKVAGSYAPPLGFEKDPARDEETLRRVNEAKPDILLIALSAPKQEKWIHRHRDRLQFRLALSIGCGLDYQAGAARRAPGWMRRVGLEWLWRIVLEPKRLARRYLVEDMAFIRIFIREWLGKSSPGMSK
jgi:exopolysaccharide biosynthesis WecB/TagA/CpsF family protein